MIAFPSLRQSNGMEMRVFCFFHITTARPLAVGKIAFAFESVVFQQHFTFHFQTTKKCREAELARTNKYANRSLSDRKLAIARWKKQSVSVREIRSCPPKAKWCVLGTFKKRDTSHVPIMLQQETVAVTSH